MPFSLNNLLASKGSEKIAQSNIFFVRFAPSISNYWTRGVIVFQKGQDHEIIQGNYSGLFPCDGFGLGIRKGRKCLVVVLPMWGSGIGQRSRNGLFSLRECKMGSSRGNCRVSRRRRAMGTSDTWASRVRPLSPSSSSLVNKTSDLQEFMV